MNPAKFVIILALASPVGAEVVFTNFGPGDSYLSANTFQIYLGVYGAMSFVPSATGVLTSIRLPLERQGPVNAGLVISLRVPGPDPNGSVIESWTLSPSSIDFPPGSIIVLPSAVKPVLAAGSAYWLRLDSADSRNDSFYAWFQSPSSPNPAFEVNASLEPEFFIRYAANLDKGDSTISFTNAGSLSGSDPAGRICVNVYTFDPAEELISCCSCPVTPNGLNSLSVRNDLTSNTLTPGAPTSVVIKLLATTPNAGACDPSTPSSSPTNMVRGLRAFGTSLHALPTSPVIYGSTETQFSRAELSLSELAKLTGFCSFIQANGSGFGICKSCRAGALGAVARQ